MPLQPRMTLTVVARRDGVSETLTLNPGETREVVKGRDFSLTCNVTLDVGHAIRLDWTKNGETLDSGESDGRTADSRNVFSLLNVSSAGEEDSGTYACVATNHLGQKNGAEVTLKVTGQSRPSPSFG